MYCSSEDKIHTNDLSVGWNTNIHSQPAKGSDTPYKLIVFLILMTLMLQFSRKASNLQTNTREIMEETK